MTLLSLVLLLRLHRHFLFVLSPFLLLLLLLLRRYSIMALVSAKRKDIWTDLVGGLSAWLSRKRFPVSNRLMSFYVYSRNSLGHHPASLRRSNANITKKNESKTYTNKILLLLYYSFTYLNIKIKFAKLFHVQIMKRFYFLFIKCISNFIYVLILNFTKIAYVDE